MDTTWRVSASLLALLARSGRPPPGHVPPQPLSAATTLDVNLDGGKRFRAELVGQELPEFLRRWTRHGASPPHCSHCSPGVDGPLPVTSPRSRCQPRQLST